MTIKEKILLELKEIKSNIDISTIRFSRDNPNYASKEKGKRAFYLIFENGQYYLTLFIKETELVKCTARICKKDIKPIVKVISLWIEKEKKIEDIKEQIPQLELFIPFKSQHENPEIEQKWFQLRNDFFTKSFQDYSIHFQNSYNTLLEKVV